MYWDGDFMPSIVTHNLFCHDVLNNINSNIDINLYQIFAQSFDELFYYSFFFPFLGKKERKFGYYCHRHNVNDYFKNIISYIDGNNYHNNKSLLSYLYGSICHYVLDKNCHPYVFYYSGDANQNKRWVGLHEKMEVEIDAYMLKLKENKDLRHESMTNRLFPKVNVDKILLECMDKVFEDTFNATGMGRKYFRSVKTGRFIMRFFVTDHFGIKKLLYRIKDFILPAKTRRYQYLSFYVKNVDKDYLNIDNNTWKYPCEPSISYNLSFVQLYEKSVREASNIINNIEDYFNNNKKLDEVLTLIGNNSYVSGISCEEERYMTCFRDLDK